MRQSFRGKTIHFQQYIEGMQRVTKPRVKVPGGLQEGACPKAEEYAATLPYEQCFRREERANCRRHEGASLRTSFPPHFIGTEWNP